MYMKPSKGNLFEEIFCSRILFPLYFFCLQEFDASIILLSYLHDHVLGMMVSDHS